jgi:hypothetical protein
MAGRADGLHWTVLEGGTPMPTGDEANIAYDAASQLYIATLKEGEMGPYGRSV